MRRNRGLAMAMAAVMLLQAPLSQTGIAAFADTAAAGRKAQQQAAERAAKATDSDAGTLKVELTGVVTGPETSWTATLTRTATSSDPEASPSETELDEGGGILTAGLTLPKRGKGDAAQTASAMFGSVPEGVYSLALEPDEDSAYLAYEQDGIRIGAKNTTLKLMNGDPEDYGYAEASAKAYGTVMLGDIDGDGDIDEKDLALLAKAVAGDDAEGGICTETEITAEEAIARSDLNGDGRADIADVSLFARFYGNEKLAGKKAKAIETPIITEKDVKPSVGETVELKEDSATIEQAFSGTAEKPLTVGAKEGRTISADEPAVIAAEFEEAKEMGAIVIDPVPGSENSIMDGEITVTDDDGSERTFAVKDGKAAEASAAAYKGGSRRTLASAIGSGLKALIAAVPAMTASAEEEAKKAAPIEIDLGGQVAVKKITIKVTKTMAKDPKLVDISKVEFLGDMEDRIPEPELSMPTGLKAINGKESFTLMWNAVANVTGYEVTVSGLCEGGNETGKFQTEIGKLEVTNINGKDLRNGNDYQVSVCSMNGDWRSKPATATAHPTTDALPPAPENVRLEPGYGQIAVSWKDMKDTKDYLLYWREAEDGEIQGGNEQHAEVSGTSYTITGLKTGTLYEVWVIGRNEHGKTGAESIHYMDRTTKLNPPVTPDYKLLNKAQEGQALTEHAKSATIGTGKIAGIEGATDGNAVIDGDYGTSWYLDDWDAGYHYGQRMPTVTLDKRYKMNTVVIIPDENQKFNYSNARLYYTDEHGKETEAPCRMSRRESNGKSWYIISTYEPFETDKVRLAVCTYGTQRRISVAELKFYYYDEIEDEVMGLYDDDYHITLKDTVTDETIQDLRDRLDTEDAESHEKHPRKDELNKELDNAAKILAGGDMGRILEVDSKDALAADKHVTFSAGLNTYQPLGVTALAGDRVTVYVGGPNVRAGDSTRLELVEAQYHGDSSAVFVSHGTLAAGINDILIKATDKNSDYERGGQLYIHYTGNAGAEKYGVRVAGGRTSAFLDISDETDRAKKVEKAKAYIEEAKKQKEDAPTWHQTDHAAAAKKEGYQPENCIYHATDIVSRRAMFSTSVDQVLAGLKKAAGSDDTAKMAEKLVDTMDAMDQMLTLFYQHKGLSDDPKAGDSNRMPVSRINIRYQRMFYGAFMYAGGKHIGIEWPELAGLMGAEPIKADEDGNYKSGRLFGWGIAHEIGHEINEGAYVAAEITNNYFAVLAQAGQSDDPNEDVRFSYDKAYAKATSGTKGKASDVFTQLAMYWQLHLAYDLDGGNYKTYDTYDEQYKNLFWARADSIVRDKSKAPNAKENPINLDTDRDNKLMRLAVAASGRNLLEMFVRYGYEPNEGTLEYASKFPAETRGLWFANDALRNEQIQKGGDPSSWNDAKSASISGSISYEPGSNQVKVKMDSDDGIRYYEIYRSERIKGSVNRRPVGYAIAGEDGSAEFTDVIGSINNRAFTYTVIGYDMWLNPTAEKEAGEVKVSHDGDIDKSAWTVTSNLENDEKKGTEEDPDAPEQPGYGKMADNRYDTAFTGAVPESPEGTAGSRTAEIVIGFGGIENITGVRYKAGDGITFKAYTSLNGADWTEAHMNTAKPEGDGMLAYFDDGTNLYTYDAAYLKLVPMRSGAAAGEGEEVTVYELSVLGQTGDNIGIDTDGIGTLSEDYDLGDGKKIEKGSLIFTGTYKGSPAYNAILLWNEDGTVAGGADEEGTVYAEQIIFAPQPEGKLGEVSEGRWVYYVAPEHAESAKAALQGRRVRVELYRVDDALTNAGERLVSSTVFMDVPAKLPEIRLSTGGTRQ